MKRREFGEKLVSSAIGGCIVSSLASEAARSQALRKAMKNTLMHVGGDYHSVAGAGITSKQNLEFNLRHGVRHLTILARKRPEGGGWDLDELKRMKDDCDQSGVTLEGIRMEADYITLRKGAGRDRELDAILGNIRKASQVGVKVITYHWTVIPIRRNTQTTGRGQASYAGFRLEPNWKGLPTGPSGPVSSDAFGYGYLKALIQAVNSEVPS